MVRILSLGVILIVGLSLSSCQFDSSLSLSDGYYDSGVGPCVGDACDECQGADSDLDGVADACDRCPGFDDGIDSDNDGVADGCDTCEAGNDDADVDQDGLPDACDSCGIGYTLSRNPIAFWRMGDSEDISGNDLNLLGVTATSYGVSQDQNPASRFDTAESVRYIENFSMPAEELTISMWVRLQPDSPKEQYFLSYFTDVDEINIGLIDDRMYVYWADGEMSSEGVPLRDGNYHHLALVYQDQSAELFFDGVKVIDLAVTIPLSEGGTLTIGQEQDELGGGFDASQVTVGDIDEVALFARPLSTNELTGLRDSYQCALTSCQAYLQAIPNVVSGTYWIAPDSVPRLAYCEMSFDGGGWTLISTNAGDLVENPSTVTPDVPAHMAFAAVSALANSSNQIHIRTKNLQATESITTSVVPGGKFAPNHPIVNLRKGALLNANSNMLSSDSTVEYWEGPFASDASRLWNSCADQQPGYPNLYWACGNQLGLHLLRQDGNQTPQSRWGFDDPEVPLEVYLR